jgi:hypothetical protein
MDALRKLSAIGVACFVALALSLSAVATTSVGSFEIDGNRADDSGPGDLILDWDSPPPNVAKFNDASGQGDDIFGIGSKELEPGGWQCVTGSAPGKDDFVNGEVAFRTLKGKQHLYVDFQRAATNGDAHMDYEFNQSREPNPACPALPKRTPGDILIAFDTANGGKAIAVRAFRWQGNAVSGSFVELQLGSKGVLWDGAVNIPNTIPGLEPGAFGEAALNLTDTIGQIGCAIFSTVYMKTRASTSITAELKDRTAALPVNFAIDRPDLANASGGALGAHVRSTLLGIDQTLVPVSTRQSGVGSRSAQDELLNVVVPSDGSLLRADVVRGSAKSTVTATPAEAVHTSTAETANVKILNGLVTASAVRAVATARANGSSSSFSSLGSAFKDLAVQGVAMNDVTPNTRIDLPAELYGPGSYVLLYEHAGSTSSPPPTQTSEGTYAADVAVNMIHVYITDQLPLVPGNQTLEIVVAHADAHADFPQTVRCPGAPNQDVSGHAFIGSEATSPAEVPATVGFVSIPPTGGHDHQDLDEARLSGLTAGASVSDSSGDLAPTASTASSYAQAAGVCALQSASGCTVGADLVHSVSNSTANGSGAASNDGDTKLLGVTVQGQVIPVEPAPNTRIEIPGVGFVILNEQFCDNGASLAGHCANGTGHAGLTVRAIHAFVTVPSNPLGLKTGEVVVAEAHSDATFRP